MVDAHIAVPAPEVVAAATAADTPVVAGVPALVSGVAAEVTLELRLGEAASGSPFPVVAVDLQVDAMFGPVELAGHVGVELPRAGASVIVDVVVDGIAPTGPLTFGASGLSAPMLGCHQSSGGPVAAAGQPAAPMPSPTRTPPATPIVEYAERAGPPAQADVTVGADARGSAPPAASLAQLDPVPGTGDSGTAGSVGGSGGGGPGQSAVAASASGLLAPGVLGRISAVDTDPPGFFGLGPGSRPD